MQITKQDWVTTNVDAILFMLRKIEHVVRLAIEDVKDGTDIVKVKPPTYSIKFHAKGKCANCKITMNVSHWKAQSRVPVRADRNFAVFFVSLGRTFRY